MPEEDLLTQAKEALEGMLREAPAPSKDIKKSYSYRLAIEAAKKVLKKIEELRPTILPARPLLANSSPEILKPIEIPTGTLQVAWIPQLDDHGLFYTHSDRKGAMLVALHNNGFSCHELARRIQSGDEKRATDQLNYIMDCGGVGKRPSIIPYILGLGNDY